MKLQEFRQSDGNLVTDKELSFPLGHLVLSGLKPQTNSNDLEKEVMIPYETIAEYLGDAEAQHEIAVPQRGFRE